MSKSGLEIGMKVTDPDQPEREAIVFDFIDLDKAGGVHWRDELPENGEAHSPVVCCEIEHLDANVPGWRTGASRDPATFHEFVSRHDADLDGGLFMVPADQLEKSGYPNHRPPDGLDENTGREEQ